MARVGTVYEAVGVLGISVPSLGVLLPVARGSFLTEAGSWGGLGLLPSLGCHDGVFQPLRRLLVGGTGSVFCLAEVRSRSLASAWPRSGRGPAVSVSPRSYRALWVSLAEVMSSSAASPASCGSCTVSSGCRGPTGSRFGVSTCSEVLFFSARSSLFVIAGSPLA